MASVLRITGIEKEDTGRVVCIASNGVKDAIQSLATNLIVNRKFRISLYICFQVPYTGHYNLFLIINRGFLWRISLLTT